MKKYNYSEFKSHDSIKKSMRKLKRILANNFYGDKNEIFVTLTSIIEIPDLKVMYEAYNEFSRRIKEDYPKILIVCVPEKYSDRNSWHLHLLLKDPSVKVLFIDNEKIEKKYWRMGQTCTLRINNNIEDSIGSVSEIEYSTNSQAEEYGIDRIIEYFCKCRTKEDIPRDCHCYYKSKNVKIPISGIMKYGEICDELEKEYILSKERTILIKDKKNGSIISKIKNEKWIKLNQQFKINS